MDLKILKKELNKQLLQIDSILEKMLHLGFNFNEKDS